MKHRHSNSHMYLDWTFGTRNVVGTVGYKEGNEFIVVAQYVMQHETRAMIDGQIHDIGRVGKVIQTVKEELRNRLNVR